MRPVLLPTIIILTWVLHHNMKKAKSGDKESISSYLKREEKANETRRKDLSTLQYIQVPFDKLPLDITLNDEILQSKIEEYKKTIYDLSEKKMLNLIGVSNLELKEKYGPANLDHMASFDQNYGNYIRTLSQFADCIKDTHLDEAVTISKYCIEIGTDISSTYTLLGAYYLDRGQNDDFEHLYECIPDKTSIASKVICNKLDALKNPDANSDLNT